MNYRYRHLLRNRLTLATGAIFALSTALAVGATAAAAGAAPVGAGSRSRVAATAILAAATADRASARAATTTPAPATDLTGPRVQCIALSHAHDALAIKMAHDIDSRLRGRISTVGLAARDSRTGITCQYHASRHFIAASAVKVIILAALLRKHQQEHLALTSAQRNLAWLMITQSDNDAATALWNEDGPYYRQHFLHLAEMRQTVLNPAWGLTLLTAHDETLLLNVLTEPNKILDKAFRIYARYLMAHVVPAQRWGVPAGAPRSVLVHVKNGWLPYPPDGPWEINSVGAFTSANRVYLIAILTYDNPSMGYGIDTIEDAAEVIHRDLNPGKHDVIPPSKPFPSWGTPDETIPTLPR